jgi:hypothetical protein
MAYPTASLHHHLPAPSKTHSSRIIKHPQRPTPQGCVKTDRYKSKPKLWLARQLLTFTGSQPTSVFASIKNNKTSPETNAPGMFKNRPIQKVNLDYGLRGSFSPLPAANPHPCLHPSRIIKHPQRPTLPGTCKNRPIP